MKISYSYRDFPGSKKLTNKSMRIGYLTGAPGMVLWALPVLFVEAALLMPFEGKINDDVYSIMIILVFIAAMFGLHRLLVKYREKAYQKLTEQYRQELEKLQQTDPAEFMKIMGQLEFASKLNKK